MKNTLIAMTSALLLTGTMSFAASAQSGYYERDDGYYSESTRYDNSYDDSYNRPYSTVRDDIDRDGVYDPYDRYDNRRGQSWDLDRDGMNDRYESNTRTYRDRDRDGIPNRYDNYDNRRYTAARRFQAGRYYAPRNYRNVRYSIGSRLPVNYYGNNYYVDYRPYGLSAPPRGYRWNRVGNDAYLISITNGLVRDVMYSLFY